MPKVSEAHLQARRQQILDAAAACFAREGFHRTSMQDIVRECGISAGLIYRYFASKDEMIAAIVTDWHTHRATVLTAEHSAGLDALAESYLGLLREVGGPEAPDARLALQVWAESVRSPEIRELARKGVDGPRRMLVEQLRGRLPAELDADALVRVLISVYQGLFVQTVWDDTLDNAAYVDTVAALLRRVVPEA